MKTAYESYRAELAAIREARRKAASTPPPRTAL